MSQLAQEILDIRPGQVVESLEAKSSVFGDDCCPELEERSSSDYDLNCKAIRRAYLFCGGRAFGNSDLLSSSLDLRYCVVGER
jgi:hypothetical protein